MTDTKELIAEILAYVGEHGSEGDTATRLLVLAERRLSEALAGAQQSAEPILTAPATVGACTFHVGVKERLVIEAAQRQYGYGRDEVIAEQGRLLRELLDTPPAAPVVPEEWREAAQLALSALNGAVSVYDVALADKARKGLRALLATPSPAPEQQS